MRYRKMGLIVIAVGFLALLSAMHAFGENGEVSTIIINPDPDSEVAPAAELSAAAKTFLIMKAYNLREGIAAEYLTYVPSPEGLPAVAGRPTVIGSETVGVNPWNLIIGRNNRNLRASTNGVGLSLAEPAAVNNGMLVFAMGNTHTEYSTNGGSTWTDIPTPVGPADALFPCCDPDVVIDHSRRITFYSLLYTNAEVNNGVVRIFVRRNINGMSDTGDTANACSYTIRPGDAVSNIIPDYPHLGITKRFLYLTINAAPERGNGFARIYRFNIDQMAECRAVTSNTFTQSWAIFGQRVWVPSEGTNNLETMLWVQHNNNTTMRIFRWSESAVAPVSYTKLLTATNFENPDCRGGTNDTDWIESGSAWGIFGFRHRCAVASGADNGKGVLACYWNAGPSPPVITQGHVRAAVFSLADLSLIGQPHIFNNAFCFGYPAVTSNDRGDIGISIAAGGKAGGGGTAVKGYVGIDDEFSSGIGFFQTVFLTATGNHNPATRFGDYFTIRRHEPCNTWFIATNFALTGGTSTTNVNSRYVEFGRNQSQQCYRAFRNSIPEPIKP